MAKPTIMCIDDDPNVVSAIHRLLFVSGYEVVSTSLEMAFEDLIEVSRPDLILLDLTMPRVSGLSILEWIRSHPQLGETPVFIVSGRSESELISKALTLGATRFIPKPFEPESLVEAIRKELHEKKGYRMKSKPVETLSPKTKDAMSALASNLLVLAAYFKQYEPLLFESFEISKARLTHQKQRGLKKLKKLTKNALPPSFIEDFGNTIYQSRDLINFVSKSLKKERIH